MIKEVPHTHMETILSMMGTSLIIQTMLPYFDDIAKDYNVIEYFFLDRYSLPKEHQSDTNSIGSFSSDEEATFSDEILIVEISIDNKNLLHNET